MAVIYQVLLLAFAIGVWKSRFLGKRPLRVAAGLLLAYAAMQPLWFLFTPSARGEARATTPLSDIGHIRKRFRIYSIATLGTELVFGAIGFTSAPRVTAGEPTPWFGVIERIDIAGWLLWLTVLAITLLRRSTSSDSKRRPAA